MNYRLSREHLRRAKRGDFLRIGAVPGLSTRQVSPVGGIRSQSRHPRRQMFASRLEHDHYAKGVVRSTDIILQEIGEASADTRVDLEPEQVRKLDNQPNEHREDNRCSSRIH